MDGGDVMSKHSGPGDPFAGSAQNDEKSPADELMDRLFACRADTERAIANVCPDGQFLEGPVNAIDRSGSNHISIGFMLSRSVSVEWHGRRIQAKVERVDSFLPQDAFQISDGEESLVIVFVPAATDPDEET